mmetsp:Transcript_121686/g.190921  ORF Transcript_121686/g.190921 Transcript_121686/m.190921 type:complete len:475 (+) Transcript_121686:49-1473(+)
MSAAVRAAEQKAKDAALKAAEDAQLAAGGGNIVVIMTRLVQGQALADRERIKLRLAKEAKLKQIKARVELEMGIDRREQNIFFRGRPVKNDEDMPLNNPDLETIVAEAGDKGLQMCVHHTPIMLDPFLEREGLVNENGEVQMKDKFPTKATALHRAARRCDIFVCRELVANSNFDLFDAKDNKGQTALHTAVCCDFLEVVEIIVKCPRFTEVGAKDSEGKTALHYACFYGDHRICKLICEHPKLARHHVLAKDKSGNSALMYAVHCGHDEAAKTVNSLFPNLPQPAALLDPSRPTTSSSTPTDEPSSANVTANPAPEAIPEKQPAEPLERKATVAKLEEEEAPRQLEPEPAPEPPENEVGAIHKQPESEDSSRATEKLRWQAQEALLKATTSGKMDETLAKVPNPGSETPIDSAINEPAPVGSVVNDSPPGERHDRESEQEQPSSAQESDHKETLDAELKPEAVASRIYTGECV